MGFVTFSGSGRNDKAVPRWLDACGAAYMQRPQHAKPHVPSSMWRSAYPSSLSWRRMLHRGNTETGSVVATGVSGSQPRTYPKVHEDHPGRAFHQGVSENLYSHPQSPKWRARQIAGGRLAVFINLMRSRC
jgi:hypothetical protein